MKAWSDVGYYALLVGGLAAFFWGKHRIERALQARTRQRASGGQRLSERLERAKEQAVLLLPAEEPKFSKLGGRPDLPSGLDWPSGETGPMRFLTQVDLASAGIEWLPNSGALYVFCDTELHDDPDFARVLHGPKGTPPPRSMGGRAVDAVSVASYASSCWLAVHDDFAGGVVSLDPGRPVPGPAVPRHQLGGFPDEIQKEHITTSCARLVQQRWWAPEQPDDWRLLLQIDSDPQLGLEFGDGGRLFICVRKADARAGDFSRTVSIWHSH